jgi:predicted phosphoadenosine phosphosulfate sulfurtransferase
MEKRYLGINVLEATRQRISWIFDTFKKICVSFSGGKDSTVLLHLVADEARVRGRKFALFFLDWEAQFKLTIEHVEAMYREYEDIVEPYWIALPFKTVNSVSQFEPEWICWDPEKTNVWIRGIPAQAISDKNYFSFYHHAMTFEEFVLEFGAWYGGNDLTAILVGIRTGESLNRYRTIKRGACGEKSMFKNRIYTTWYGDGIYNVYPIYDWKTEDDWRYFGKFCKPYNKIYDLMYKAGIPIHNMRIDEPFGNEQRRGLYLFSVIEPETWGKLVARVNGANMGALYANEKGNVLGNIRIEKPEGKTWKQFALVLLASMPPKTSEHYQNKIAVYLHWYKDRGYPEGIPDIQLEDCTQRDNRPSWRRICKVILKNDYWCRGLSFSPTKANYYEKYLKVMKYRRRLWKIF